MREEELLSMEEAVPLQEIEQRSASKMNVYQGVLPTYSMKTKCNQCNMEIYSIVVRTLRKDIWIWPLFFCCCGLMPCACYLYPIVNWFMEWRHFCGKCGVELAIYKQPYTRGIKRTLILLGVFGFFTVAPFVYVLGKYMGFWGY